MKTCKWTLLNVYIYIFYYYIKGGLYQRSYENTPKLIALIFFLHDKVEDKREGQGSESVHFHTTNQTNGMQDIRRTLRDCRYAAMLGFGLWAGVWGGR